MAGIHLQEARERPATEGMTEEALLTLKEWQLIGRIELIRVSVIECAPAVLQFRNGICNVVVRLAKSANGVAPREQFGVGVQELRVGVSGLELQAVPHALLRFHDQGIVIGIRAVRAIVEAGIKCVGPDGT